MVGSYHTHPGSHDAALLFSGIDVAQAESDYLISGVSKSFIYNTPRHTIMMYNAATMSPNSAIVNGVIYPGASRGSLICDTCY